jgi:SAM-dependent methyltransferase
MESTVADIEDLFVRRVLPLYDGHVYQATLRREGLTPRVRFYFEELDRLGLLAARRRVLDLGAGLGVFAPLGRLLGLKVRVVDDFGGGGGVENKADPSLACVLARFRELGLEIVDRNLLSDPLPAEDATIDLAVSFHSIEHWHHSPRRLFAEIRRVLRPGGALMLASPNSVNLRKRLSAAAGRSPLGTLEEWYHDGDPVFRGHVREPTLAELERLAEWNGLSLLASGGRNFIARDSVRCAQGCGRGQRLYRTALALADPLLRLRPSLCSDLHVIAAKPTAANAA